VGVDEGKVAFQQLSDVGGSRVVDGNLALCHDAKLHNPGGAQRTGSAPATNLPRATTATRLSRVRS
jgi:hypothetical protein